MTAQMLRTFVSEARGLCRLARNMRGLEFGSLADVNIFDRRKGSFSDKPTDPVLPAVPSPAA